LKNCEHCNEKIADSRKRCPHCNKDVGINNGEDSDSFPKGCFFIIALPISIFLIWFLYMLFTVGPNWEAMTPGRVGFTLFLLTSAYLYNKKGIDVFDFLNFSRSKKSNAKREKEFEDWINKKIDEEMDKEDDEEKFYDDMDQNNEQQLENKYSKILGLNGGESIKDIESSYRKLIKMYHPDKVASMGKEIIKTAEEKTKELNDAYDFFKKNHN
jgi:hypothetical protein